MQVFCSFNFLYATRSLGQYLYTQVELILTIEDLLRSIGRHKRFITGRKTISPNLKATAKDNQDKMEESGCVGLIRRFIVWIYFGFKEYNSQLWWGRCYDTLEIIQETLVRYI